MIGDCNVCLDQDDGDSVQEVWQVSEVRARKPYKCYECDDVIPVGAKHQLVKTLYDGTWDRYRTCLPCVEIHRAMTSCGNEDGRAGCRCLGVLWDDVQEYVFPDMTMGCVARCETAAAREKLLKAWNEWKFE